MIWVTKVHHKGSSSTTLDAVEHDEFTTPKAVAMEAIEGYGVDDIDHIEIVRIPDDALRGWLSFDVKVSLENQDGP